MIDLDRLASGPVTLTEEEKEGAAQMLQFVQWHKTQKPNAGVALMLDPESRDLLHLLLLCGLAAIENGRVELKP